MHNLLKLNLQFFSADTGSEGGSSDSDTWVDEFLTGEKATEDMIPKKRFDDINNRYKSLNDDYKNRQVEYDEMTKKVSEGETTSKTLTETIEAGNARVEALEGVLQVMLDGELEQIDEEYRDLVPTDKPIEEQLKWLASAKSKGLFGTRGIEFEIGQMTNPRQSTKGAKVDNMNPLQLLTMGYSK